MEWVEITGRTIEEAKEIALDQLGVVEDEAEFEVLEEPKPGLFGRNRGEARIRARVKPAVPRAKADRRQRRDRNDRDRGERSRGRSTGEGSQRRRRSTTPRESSRNEEDRPVREQSSERTREEREPVNPEQVGETAAEFLRGLVSAFGADGTVTVDREDDELDVRVEGDDLGLMVGPRGVTLQAIQDLTRVASQRRLGDQDTRLRVDIAGYREKRRDALTRFALKVAEEVRESGQARLLEPMLPADRKIVHDALAEVDGIATRSQGEDPRRRVVVEATDND